ncbi:hypothetical protein MRX96_023424 [Rhipicephalus microplus]
METYDLADEEAGHLAPPQVEVKRRSGAAAQEPWVVRATYLAFRAGPHRFFRILAALVLCLRGVLSLLVEFPHEARQALLGSN